MTAHERFTADDDQGDNSSFSTSLLSSSSFQYRLSHRDDVTWIAIRGTLEDEDKDAFRKVLFQRIDIGNTSESAESSDKEKARDIVLDLDEVTFLSESALAVLIQVQKAQRAQGAALRLVHLSPRVRRKLERTAVIQFFSVDE
jgi:anti-anti-sigma factor